SAFDMIVAIDDHDNKYVATGARVAWVKFLKIPKKTAIQTPSRVPRGWRRSCLCSILRPRSPLVRVAGPRAGGRHSAMTRRARLFPRIVVAAVLAYGVGHATNPGLHAQSSTRAAALNGPTGASTGTATDVTVKDAKNPTLPEVMDAVGHNRIAINVM